MYLGGASRERESERERESSWVAADTVQGAYVSCVIVYYISRFALAVKCFAALQHCYMQA